MVSSSTRADAALPVRSRIYRTLYESSGFCSRQTLAQACAVSMPTIYQSLNELMDEGLVRVSGEGRSTGGRKARGLDIVPDARIAVGMAVTEDQLRLVAVDLRLQELAYRKLPFDPVGSPETRTAALPGIVDSFLSDAGLDRQRVLGVGITIPGILTPDHTSIFFAPTLGLRDVPLRELTKDIPYPVRVDNDGSASGPAECFLRGGRQNLAYLSLENGVGGAVLMAGQPYEGDHARSGEFGHICVEPGGLLCNCGKRGCLEAYCSPLRIEKELGVTPDGFFRGVEDHIPEYEELLYDILRHLAIAVNDIHMALDCDVILGGFFSEYLIPYMPVLRRYVLAGNPFEENADFLQFSALRHHVSPLGGALFYIREFVSSV